MAYHWIAYDVNLPSKPEVFRLARELDLSREIVVARLLVLWAWADSQTTDGYLDGMEPGDIDQVTGTDGMGKALLEVGWLVQDNGGILLPNWERWNTSSTKARLQDAARKRRERAERSAE